jgi:hypothetical protein
VESEFSRWIMFGKGQKCSELYAVSEKRQDTFGSVELREGMLV